MIDFLRIFLAATGGTILGNILANISIRRHHRRDLAALRTQLRIEYGECWLDHVRHHHWSNN